MTRPDAPEEGGAGEAARELRDGLAKIGAEFRASLAEASDEPSLRERNARWVGPGGALTRLMKLMPKVPAAYTPPKANRVFRPSM